MSVLEQFRLDGRVAVVTGGTKGLGKAMATAFAEAGAHVVVCSRHAAECQAVADELARVAGRPCLGHAADITRQDDVEALMAAATQRFGRLDVLVNNAGINVRHPIEEFPVEDFDRILQTNVRGVWLCCRAVAPILKQQRRGSVINLSSALGLVGLADRSAYCTSKSAVVGLTKTLALEWAPFGVRCNALCPGPFMTEINEVFRGQPEKAQALLNLTAFKRWGELPEIQGAALFLASDASSFMTGAMLSLDGGWVAG
jgi:NAD(P)-dependent dehydrogenase (short-subunit alcohol dehydrogenase family)